MKKKFSSLLALEILIAIGLVFVIHRLILAYRHQIYLTSPTTLTPTSTLPLSPKKRPERIKIIDGNVCSVTNPEEPKILVNKDDFQSQAITRFAEVKVSPDQTKMCFLGYAPVPIWLYYANIDGGEVTRVSLAKNCVWSHDSQKIAYNNHVTDFSRVDVYVYDIPRDKNKNLTKGAAEEGFTRFYDLPRWSHEDQKITARFTAIKMPDEKTKKEGLSEINLSTGEIIDQILTKDLVDF